MFLSSSERLIKIQQLFIILTILKKNFFSEDKISKVWLKIKFKIFRHVEGATCQHMGVVQREGPFAFEIVSKIIEFSLSGQIISATRDFPKLNFFIRFQRNVCRLLMEFFCQRKKDDSSFSKLLTFFLFHLNNLETFTSSLPCFKRYKWNGMGNLSAYFANMYTKKVICHQLL